MRSQPLSDGGMATPDRPQFAERLWAIHRDYPGLTLIQLLTFLTVAEQEGIRIGDLAIHMSDSAANASRNVRRLTQEDYAGSIGKPAGLLKLLRGARNGRARHVILSDKGRALYRTLTDQRLEAALPGESSIAA